ncbi:sigma factor [Mycolicibacterium fluoranthenivorans]|uniref:Sigma-70 region 2 n=1 Tax=Mycolicibacterium fluoranthenivorans TaxID=258505 RepID=A0A1G4VW20_9MYCO|nr:sigma factor [Mycolicibacterium fluoranthenivorans]SCX12812.1 Sigma-70 region 2 [Mycolicibacterium fluoranthenivorans]
MSGVEDPAEFGWTAAEAANLRQAIRDADYLATVESWRAYLHGVDDETAPDRPYRYLVMAEAKSRTGAGVAFLDLLIAGGAGLQRAMETFDPAAGHPFTVHAQWWIRRAMTL